MLTSYLVAARALQGLDKDASDLTDGSVAVDGAPVDWPWHSRFISSDVPLRKQKRSVSGRGGEKENTAPRYPSPFATGLPQEYPRFWQGRIPTQQPYAYVVHPHAWHPMPFDGEQQGLRQNTGRVFAESFPPMSSCFTSFGENSEGELKRWVKQPASAAAVGQDGITAAKIMTHTRAKPDGIAKLAMQGRQAQCAVAAHVE